MLRAAEASRVIPRISDLGNQRETEGDSGSPHGLALKLSDRSAQSNYLICIDWFLGRTHLTVFKGP